MTKDNVLGKAIREARISRSLSQGQLGELVGGISRAAVSQWESGKTAPANAHLRKIAQLLECDLNWLMTGQVPDKKPGLDEASGELIVVKEKREIPVIGQVEAGVWREHLEPDDEVYKTVSYYDDHLTRGMNLVAIKVAGNSYNRIYPPGTVVVVALLSEIGRDAEHSDVCIVQRRSKEGLYEYTLKQLIVDADGNRMLWPNSLDPRYQTPIEFNPTGEDDEIQITGIVIRAITTTDRRLATDFL